MFDSFIHLQDFIAQDSTRAILVAVLMVIATAICAHILTRAIRRVVQHDGVPLPSSSILVNVGRIAVWCLGLGLMLSICFRVDVNALIAAIGVGGIALSLGLQDTIKNFIGGLQVTLMRIVEPGDHIEIAGTEGIVEDVLWRHTRLRDYDGQVHIIPNSVINSTEVTKITPAFIVSTTVVINNDGRDIDALIAEMEGRAKAAVATVAPLERFLGILVTQIGEYGIWAKLRFVLENPERAREARDAALRAIAPYTRNSAQDVLEE